MSLFYVQEKKALVSTNTKIYRTVLFFVMLKKTLHYGRARVDWGVRASFLKDKTVGKGM